MRRLLAKQADDGKAGQEQGDQRQQRQAAKAQPAEQVSIRIQIEIGIAGQAQRLDATDQQHQQQGRYEDDIFRREKKACHP